MVGAISELVTCVRVARGNMVDLAISIPLNGAMQMSLFVVPLLVFLSAFSATPLTLSFALAEVIAVPSPWPSPLTSPSTAGRAGSKEPSSWRSGASSPSFSSSTNPCPSPAREAFAETAASQDLPKKSSKMNYLYLAIAIISEVFATSTMKATEGFTRLVPSVIVIAGYVVAFYFLSLTLRTIPVGIAYAIWSGAGVALVAAVAWIVYGQRLDAPAIIGLALIIAGVLILNLFSKSGSH